VHNAKKTCDSAIHIGSLSIGGLEEKGEICKTGAYEGLIKERVARSKKLIINLGIEEEGQGH